MMLNVVMNEYYVQPLCKAKHSKLKESPVASNATRQLWCTWDYIPD